MARMTVGEDGRKIIRVLVQLLLIRLFDCCTRRPVKGLRPLR